MTIEDWRRRIDGIDDHLLRLLNRRAQLAVELARLKRAAGLPVEDPGREQQVLARVCQRNQGPLDGSSVAALFTHIIRACRALGQKSQGSPDVRSAGTLRSRQRGRRGKH